MRHLAEVLKHNHTVTVLSLGGNPLGPAGYQAFAGCLRNKTRGLQRVDLSNTALDEVAMRHLGMGLRENSSVLSIDVSKKILITTGVSDQKVFFPIPIPYNIGNVNTSID